MVLGLKVVHGETIIAAEGADSVLAQAITPSDPGVAHSAHRC